MFYWKKYEALAFGCVSAHRAENILMPMRVWSKKSKIEIWKIVKWNQAHADVCWTVLIRVVLIEKLQYYLLLQHRNVFPLIAITGEK